MFPLKSQQVSANDGLSQTPVTCGGYYKSIKTIKLLEDTGADPGFFLAGGALVSCSTSTPINHIVFFWRIPVVLDERRSSQGRGGVCTPCTLPLDPSLGHRHTIQDHSITCGIQLMKPVVATQHYGVKLFVQHPTLREAKTLML